MIRRPMLAASVKEVERLRYPLIASPKIDGIRALVTSQGLVSRTLKPIPNKHVRDTLRDAPLGLDGELIAGKTFQECTSAIMAHEGAPVFGFWVFDWFGAGFDMPYRDRIGALIDWVTPYAHPAVQVVPTEEIRSRDELQHYEERALARGFEGVMLRDPFGPYKQGRSTEREGFLLKLKRFEDAEATVIGFEEKMHNANEAKTNELGLTKRSSAAAGKVAAGTLGALLCRLPSGVEFGIGAGLTDELRAEVWARREEYLGKLVKFKHQPFGAKDAPRLPVFLGFRHEADT